MKQSFFSLLLLTTLAVACKKGDTGPEGAPGIDGNANVTQYSFGPQNFAASPYLTMSITTTQDTMNNSTWLVYLYHQQVSRWYFVPGQGYAGATFYRVSMGYANNKVNIYIDRDGPGENYSSAKVIRIHNNISLPGGRTRLPHEAAGIDTRDYEAVRQFYGLRE